MTTLVEPAAAAAQSLDDIDIAGWDAGFDAVFARVAPRFASEACRRQARAYLRGLLSDVARKNSWNLAVHAGDSTPDKSQRLLNSYVWDDGEVRADLRGYVADEFGEPGAVLVVDETGFLKKGTKSVGVQRQYSGTAGRTENCQLGVFLSYVSARGRAPLDVRLYLPNKTWAADRARCTEAGVPADVGFATKTALAREMIEQAWDAGLPFAWVTGDEVYGRDPKLAAWLEEHGVGYVLAVDCDHRVTTAAGRFRVDELAARVPAQAWQPYAAADGAKGPRVFDWALIAATDTPAGSTRPRCVLVRRSRTDPSDLAYYLCHAPRPVPMATFVAVAGRRWSVEEVFQAGKNEVGYDHYQVRLHHAWYRHLTLAMLAHAWLAATAARAGAGGQRPESAWEPTGPTATGYAPGPGGGLPLDIPAEVARCELVPLSVNEIRRLHAAFHQPRHPPGHTLHWSRWRRRHQARARRCHYRRRVGDQRDRGTRRRAARARAP